MQVVKDAPLPEQHGTIKYVGLMASLYGNSDGTKVHPGVQRLMDSTGLSDKTVRRHLDLLVDYGLLWHVAEHRRRREGQPGLSNEYQLCAPMLWTLEKWGGTRAA